MPYDTTPDAHRAQIKALSQLTGPERLTQALELSDLVLEIHAAGGRARSRARGKDVVDAEETGSTGQGEE